MNLNTNHPNENPNWDSEILRIIFKEYKNGLLLPTYAVIVVVLYSFFMTQENHNITYNSIRISLLLLSILYILFFKIANESQLDWHFILITILFLGYVELQILEINEYYYYPSKWIGILILMLYQAFYFKSTPILFIIYWFLLLTYFYLRLLLTPYSSFDPFKLYGMYSYIFPFYIFSCGFNYLWLRNRYTNLVYLRDLEIETSKRIAIEKELSTQIVTKAMKDDIHKHIGTAIQDFKININTLINTVSLDKDTIKEVYYSINKAEDALKININSYNDLNFIQENFFSGIEKVLLRRYEIFHRQAIIQYQDLENTELSELKDFINVRHIFLICREICSNDLKYGSGISVWNWIYNNELILEFSSNTNYNRADAGKGSKSILNRLGYLKGNSEFTINEGKFTCKLRFPFHKSINNSIF